MEKSMQEFVRRVFETQPDFSTVTKGALRAKYLKEEGLNELTKSDRKIFSDVVDYVLSEFTDFVQPKEVNDVLKRNGSQQNICSKPPSKENYNNNNTVKAKSSDLDDSISANSDSEALEIAEELAQSSEDDMSDDETSKNQTGKVTTNGTSQKRKLSNKEETVKPKRVKVAASHKSPSYTSSEDENLATVKDHQKQRQTSPVNSDADQNVSDEDESLAVFKNRAQRKTKGEQKYFKPPSSDSENTSDDSEKKLLKTKYSPKGNCEPSSDESDDDYEESVKKPKRKPIGPKASIKKKRKVTLSSESSSYGDEALAVLKSHVKENAKAASSAQKTKECSSSSDDESLAALKSRENGKEKLQKTGDDGSGSSSLDKPLKARCSPKGSHNRSSEDSDDDYEESVKKPKRKPVGHGPKASVKKKRKVTLSSESSSSGDEALAVLKSHTKENAKVASSAQKTKKCSNSSDDESLAAFKSREKGKEKLQKTSDDGSGSSSEDKPLKARSSPKGRHDQSSEDSDDDYEESVKKPKRKPIPSKVSVKKKIKATPSSGSSGSGDEPLAVLKSHKKENAKAASSAYKTKKCSSSSDDESLAALKSREKGKKTSLKADDDDSSVSSSEDKPLKARSSVKDENIGLSSEESSSEDDEEAVHKKKSKTEKSKKKNDKGTSRKSEATADKRKKAAISASNSKIERLKKYLRAAGFHIKSYGKIWESCKSEKAKAEKLLEMLQKEGLKGRPTLEKCKKLKKKIEKKKEFEELDMSNIIETKGRPKRNTHSLYSSKNKTVIPSEESESDDETPAENVFERLKDLVDSDDSDKPVRRPSKLKAVIDSEDSD